jgi:hypothetical protein
VNTTAIAVGANVVANTTAILVGNSTVNSSVVSTQIRVANSTASVNVSPISVIAGISTVNATVVAVGANVIANATALFVGNSTVNSVVTATQVSVGANVVANATALSVGNSTVNSIITSTQVAVGANVIANATTLFVGNSTVNASHTATLLQVSNASGIANLSPVDLRVGISTVNATIVAVGANVIANATTLFVGNTTVNATHTATLLQVSNASGIANLSPVDLRIGTSTVNSTVVAVGANVIANATALFIGNTTVNSVVTSAQVSVGANVIANATTLFVGNATVNASHTATLLQVSNSTSTANLSPVDLRVGISTVNATVVAVGANVIANATALFVGNATVNSLVTATQIRILNATASVNVSPSEIKTADFTLNSTAISLGSNVTIESSRIALGNTTVNTVINSTAAAIGANSSTTALLVGANGNIGIGNTTPTDKLSVAGTLRLSGNATVVNVYSTYVNTGHVNATANITVGSIGSTNGVSIQNTSISIGNNSVNGTITSTTFSGSANNTSFVGSVSAANVVSNAQLSGNLTNYALLSGATFTGVVQVSNNVTITGGANISGNLYVNSSITVNGNFNVTGNLVTSGTFQAQGDIIPDTDAKNLGNTTLRWNLVGINANMAGNVAVAQNLTVANTITVGNSIVNSTIMYTGNATVYSYINKDSVQTTGNVVATNVYATALNVSTINATANITVGSIGTTNGISIQNTSIVLGNNIVNSTINSSSVAFTNSTVTATINATSYTGTANNATNLNGQGGAFYTNATNITTGTLPYSQIPVNVINTTAVFTRTANTTFNANVILGAGLSANGGFGTAGQTLHSNGTATYWAVDDNTTYDLLAVTNTAANEGILRLRDSSDANDNVLITGANGIIISSNATHLLVTGTAGDINGVAAGNGLTGGGTSGDVSLAVVAGTGVVVNATGVHVNASYVTNTDSRTLSGNLEFSGANVTYTAGLKVGANVITNTTALFIGNSTVNASHTSSLLQVSNSTSTANLTALGFFAGIASVNTTQINVGANVYSNATTVFVGNSTVNSTHNSGLLQVSNSTSTANLTATAVQVYTNSTVNATHTASLLQVSNSTSTANLTALDLRIGISTVNATAVAVGANVIANATALLVGNSTVNATVNSIAVAFINSTATATINATNFTGTSNNASNFNGQPASFYANADNITSGTLPYARIPVNVVNTTAAFTRTGNTTFNANVILGAGLSANGGFGTAGQVLHSNGTATYWALDDSASYDLLAVANTTVNQGIIRLRDSSNANDDILVSGANGIVVSSNATHLLVTGTLGDITGVSAANGLSGGGTSGDVSLLVVAGTGLAVNTTGVHVNASYIATIAANNASFLGGTAAASYVQNTDSRTLSGNLNFTAANVNFASGLFVGANVIANTSALFVGNSTVNSLQTATLVRVSNASGIANLSPVDLRVGISTVNATVVAVGANVIVNASTLFVGNSIVNSTVNSIAVAFINSTATATINATNFSGTSNNASNFNGQPASFYANAQNITSGTLNTARISGEYTGITAVGTLANLTVTANANFDTGTLFVDAVNNRVGVRTTTPSVALHIVANDAIFIPVGNTTQRPTGANGMIRYNSELVRFEGFANSAWGSIGGGGGYYKGNLGAVGETNSRNNLYRINSNTQSNNVTIDAGENALTAGPVVIQDGFNLTISEGGRVVIV